MTTQSEAINELATALAKAQAEIEKASKDGKNPHFKSKYATLSSVWEACKPALTANGLSVVQTMDDGHESGHVVIVTTLLHSSGQWIRGRHKIRLVKDDAQGSGSAISYGRRYGLAALVGVCTEDDDAESAVDRTRQNNTRPMPSREPYSTKSPKQQCLETAGQILDVMKFEGWDQQEFFRITKLESIQALVEEGTEEAARELGKAWMLIQGEQQKRKKA